MAGSADEASRTEVRLWAVSDIHTDIPDNAEWVNSLSDTAYQHDALILAGDVSEDLDILEATLTALRQKFRYLFFTPGNHDLWLLKGEQKSPDSLAKLQHILELCQRLDVATGARRIAAGESEQHGIWVCPLLSWHHQSFDTEPDLEGWEIPSAEQVMVDYHACRFPSPLSMLDESVARAVDALNDGAVLGPAANAMREQRLPGEPLVTFSHFLPRVELSLEKRFLMAPQLPKASGSRFLGDRVRALAPDVHIFGHTHFGWDAVHDGVRYIQAALAYPNERRARWPSLAIGDLGCAGPLLLWSSESGFVPKMKCRWSEYYEHHGRHPERVFELASYSAKYYQKIDARAVECMPDFSFKEQ
eukprot:TRINITY_DN28738_c0_g1_i1.p1 TRINITY_DN28738_c0_g1~~TRINITY_DN28738_c0_g1_i1.p1  ORF type:complete len:407 (+),score=63.38 TRINITY_DN28738_c0_g1_i1:143-1222(+)